MIINRKNILKDSNSDGFTIVELTIAVTVTSLLLMLIMNFMADGLYSYAMVTARRDLLAEAQRSLDLVADETRSSANADLNNRWQDTNGPGAPNNLYGWTSNSSTLILATAAENSAKDVIFADPAQYITEKNNNIYFVTNGTLYKRTLAAPVAGNTAKTTCPSNLATTSCPADKALISNISSFQVKYIDGDGDEVTPTNARSVEMIINLSKLQYKKTITADYKTRMVFRND